MAAPPPPAINPPNLTLTQLFAAPDWAPNTQRDGPMSHANKARRTWDYRHTDTGGPGHIPTHIAVHHTLDPTFFTNDDQSPIPYNGGDTLAAGFVPGPDAAAALPPTYTPGVGALAWQSKISQYFPDGVVITDPWPYDPEGMAPGLVVNAVSGHRIFSSEADNAIAELPGCLKHHFNGCWVGYGQRETTYPFRASRTVFHGVWDAGVNVLNLYPVVHPGGVDLATSFGGSSDDMLWYTALLSSYERMYFAATIGSANPFPYP